MHIQVSVPDFIASVDSAKVLIQNGIQSSLKNKDKYNYYKYLSLQGYYKAKTENYKKVVNDLLFSKSTFQQIRVI